jgi:hypothetical protein
MKANSFLNTNRAWPCCRDFMWSSLQSREASFLSSWHRCKDVRFCVYRSTSYIWGYVAFLNNCVFWLWCQTRCYVLIHMHPHTMVGTNQGERCSKTLFVSLISGERLLLAERLSAEHFKFRSGEVKLKKNRTEFGCLSPAWFIVKKHLKQIIYIFLTSRVNILMSLIFI